MRNENELRDWVRKWWDGFMVWREPRRGIGEGAPDVDLLLPPDRAMGGGGASLLPVELKIWKPGRKVVRPSQISWHREAALHQLLTAFIVVWPLHHPDTPFIIPGSLVRQINSSSSPMGRALPHAPLTRTLLNWASVWAPETPP